MAVLMDRSWISWRSLSFRLTMIWFLVVFLSVGKCASDPKVLFSTHDVYSELHDNCSFTVTISPAPNQTLSLNITSDRTGSVDISPSIIYIDANETSPEKLSQTVTVVGNDYGQMNVYVDYIDAEYYNIDDAYLRLWVRELASLDTLDDVIGWLYFVAWSVSFYPQIWINFRRRTVRGLNLDYVSFNVLGFFCYSVYNCGLYFNKGVQATYASRHPYGVVQVAIQDVVFALHALFASLLTGIEAIIFDRAGQRVSRVCLCLLGIMLAFLVICLILSGVSVIAWLDYLYYISYVKLAITLIKYVPQAYFNFRRKSTKGWSIGNVILDFTGGMLSMLQMFIQAYNYNDWDSLFGDPTKFALGLFSVLFDVLFMIQHYCLYRNKSSDYDSMPTTQPPQYADLVRTSATEPQSNGNSGLEVETAADSIKDEKY